MEALGYLPLPEPTVKIQVDRCDHKQMEALGYLPLPEPTVKIQVDRTVQIDNLLRALNCCYTNMRAGFFQIPKQYLRGDDR
jgi:hypothetical protein